MTTISTTSGTLPASSTAHGCAASAPAATGGGPTEQFVLPAPSAPAPAPTMSATIPTAATAAPSTTAPTALSGTDVAALQSMLTALLQALQGAQARAAVPAASPASAAVAAPTATETFTPTVASAAPAAAVAPVGATSTPLSVSGTAADQRAVNDAIAKLGTLPSGATLARQLQTSGARFFVDDDSSFDAKGYGGARAYYDETANEIHLRRSVVQNPDPTELIGQIAHEGTHFIDAFSANKRSFMQRRQAEIAALGGTGTAAGAAASKQLFLDDALITETNAHALAGRVLTEAGARQDGFTAGNAAWTAMGSGDPESVRRAVWDALLRSPNYNPTGARSSYQTYA